MNKTPELPSEELPSSLEAGLAEFERIFNSVAAQGAAMELEIVPDDQIDQAYVLRLATQLGIPVTHEEAHYYASKMREYLKWLNHFSTWPYVGDAPLG